MPSALDSKIRKNLAWLAVAAIVLILLAAGWAALRRSIGRLAGDFFYPYLAVSRKASDTLSDQTLLLYSRHELARELEFIRRENRRLAAQAANAAKLLLENDELRRIAKLSPAEPWKYVNAEIILRDPRLWNERVIVDQGSDDGVLPGATAMTVAPDGRLIFVGVVARVSRRTAEIMTVNHPELRISAALPVSNAIGLINAGVQARTPGLIGIGFLPVKRNYVPDEILQTTGFERQVPPGAKIGNLSTVENLDSLFASQNYLSGEFQPAAQLSSIRFLILAMRPDRAIESEDGP